MTGGGAVNSTTGRFLDLGVTTLAINSIAIMMNFTYDVFIHVHIVHLRISVFRQVQWFSFWEYFE